jgi:hypothetical protein
MFIIVEPLWKLGRKEGKENNRASTILKYITSV